MGEVDVLTLGRGILSLSLFFWGGFGGSFNGLEYGELASSECDGINISLLWLCTFVAVGGILIVMMWSPS